MNLINLLNQLRESIEIEKLNSLIKNDVPSHTINTLASRMKKGKYDNKAEAILKAAQDWKGIKGDYLRDNAGKVYAILKLIGKDNSAFKAEDILNKFKESSASSPKELDAFWQEEYSKATSGEYKRNKKETLGLKNARVKRVNDAYLIFPKTFKKQGELGIPVEDLDKQYADIKQLGAELARKDTSGESKGEKKASDVHWCVASPGDKGVNFNAYKNVGGIFVVIVKPKEDGSPDWNRRYLYFMGKDGNTEFADKFDSHVAPTSVLGKSTISLLNKMAQKVEEGDKVSDREIRLKLDSKARGVKKKYRSTLKPSENLEKIFALFAERNEESLNKGEIKQVISVIQEINDELSKIDSHSKLIDWFEKHKARQTLGSSLSVWEIVGDPLTIKLYVNKYGVVSVKFMYKSKYADSYYYPSVGGANFEELRDKLLRAKKEGVFKVYDGGEWGYYSRNLAALDRAKDVWRFSEAVPTSSKEYQDSLKDLRGNKKVIDVYNKLVRTSSPTSLDSHDEFQIVNDNGKLKVVYRKRGSKMPETSLGYIDDPNTLQAIKKKLSVADPS